MDVFIVGATGFIGRHLSAGLIADGHNVVGLSRNAQRAGSVLPSGVRVVEGDPMSPGSWQEEIDGVDAVINVVGEPIMGGKWTEERKQYLRDSRIKPTLLINEGIEKAAKRPKVFICGSAIGFYGGRQDELLPEDSSAGTDFSALMCRDWEGAAKEAEGLGVRVVSLRTSFVLGRDGGALADMVKPFRMFMGGPMGDGNQFIPWIHIDDYVSLVKAILVDDSFSGPINMSAGAVTNREFAKGIGRAINRPSWLPVPGFVLKMIFGEGASLLLEGQRTVPARAKEIGFQFSHSDLGEAFDDVLKT